MQTAALLNSAQPLLSLMAGFAVRSHLHAWPRLIMYVFEE